MHAEKKINQKCNIKEKDLARALKEFNEHIIEKCIKEFINCPNQGCILKSLIEEERCQTIFQKQ